MPRPQDPLTAAIAGLRWALGLTWVGMIAERLVRAFWPVWSLCAMIAAVLLLGLHDRAPIEIVWSGLVLGGLALLVLAGWGVARFRFPRRDEVVTRLDAVLPGRPLAALADVQAIGAGDDGSEALWRAHRARMLTVPLPGDHATRDLDTPEDWADWRRETGL